MHDSAHVKTDAPTIFLELNCLPVGPAGLFSKRAVLFQLYAEISNSGSDWMGEEREITSITVVWTRWDSTQKNMLDLSHPSR